VSGGLCKPMSFCFPLLKGCVGVKFCLVRSSSALAHLQPLGWLLLEQNTELKSPVLVRRERGLKFLALLLVYNYQVLTVCSFLL